MTLDQALAEASAAVTTSTEGVRPGDLPTPDGGHGLKIAAIGVLVAIGVVASVVVAFDRTSSITTEPATGAARFVTDVAPEGLSLEFSGPVADLEAAVGTQTRWVYGKTDRGPVGEEQRIVVMALTGRARPPGLLDGRDVDINGLDGRVLADGTVMFATATTTVSILGSPTGEDLVAVARSLGRSDDGTVTPPQLTPGGYELLGRLDEGLYEEVDGAAPLDAQVTSYRQGRSRYLSLIARSRTPELDTIYRWLAPPGADTLTVGERTYIYLYAHDDFGAPATFVVWYDDHIIGEAISYGIDRSQVDAALTAVRTSDDPPVRVGQDVPAPDHSDTDDTTIDEPNDRLAPTVVLDNMEIATAVDHHQLGPPDWRADQYLYGPADVDTPEPDDPVLLLTVADSSDGLLVGEPIEIGGHDGVIIDKAAAGTTADVEVRIGDTTVQLTGRANIELESLVAAAEQYALWVAGGGNLALGAPSTIGVDLTLRGSEQIGAWLGADINGPMDGTSIVYAEPGTTSQDGARRLTITSTSRTNRSVDWLAWLFPGRTTTIDLGGIDAAMVEPGDDITVLRFEHADRVIEATGKGVSLDEVIRAVSPFALDHSSD